MCASRYILCAFGARRGSAGANTGSQLEQRGMGKGGKRMGGSSGEDEKEEDKEETEEEERDPATRGQFMLPNRLSSRVHKVSRG